MNKEIITKLEKLWERNPNQRFGQLLFNYTPIGQRAGLGKVKDPFHLPDDVVEEYLDHFLKEEK